MYRQTISKLKDNLESKHKEKGRVMTKLARLKEEAKDLNSHSIKTRIENSVYKLRADLKSIDNEIEDLKQEIYGSWAPKKENK
ncbi:MAG: hypothetical protein V3U94_02865 [Candidatus Thorarchaeota archaeon]